MMMTIQAEYLKTIRHKWMVGFTLYIFPVGILAFGVTIALLVMLGADRGALFRDTSSFGWDTIAMGSWRMTLDAVAQVLLMVFAANVFANESKWNTWKNIVSREQRWRLFLAKLIVVLGLIFVTFNVMALLTGIGSQFFALATDLPLRPDFADRIGTFIPDYLQTMSVSMIGVSMAMMYAIFATTFTRSVIASVIIGYGVRIFEMVARTLFFVLENFFNITGLVDLYRFTPSYNLDNIQSWLDHGRAFDLEVNIDRVVTGFSLETSLLILAVIFILLVTASIQIFNRRDVA